MAEALLVGSSVAVKGDAPREKESNVNVAALYLAQLEAAVVAKLTQEHDLRRDAATENVTLDSAAHDSGRWVIHVSRRTIQSAECTRLLSVMTARNSHQMRVVSR